MCVERFKPNNPFSQRVQRISNLVYYELIFLIPLQNEDPAGTDSMAYQRTNDTAKYNVKQ